MLKVPRSWLVIMGLFVIIAAAALRHFSGSNTGVSDTPRYPIGTCLKDSESHALWRVEKIENGFYEFKVLATGAFPEGTGGPASALRQPTAKIDESSHARPVPCPLDR